MIRALVTFAFAAAALAACANPKHPEAPMSAAAPSTDAVRDVVTSLVHDLDAKRWDALPPLFTETVETDYTSLFGGEVQRQPAAALVGAWQGILAPVQTQHVLGPIVVTFAGDRATAECHVRGYHVKEGLPGGSEWMVAGHYVFELARDAGGGGWRIARLTLQTYYQTGNRTLLQDAAAPR